MGGGRGKCEGGGASVSGRGKCEWEVEGHEWEVGGASV